MTEESDTKGERDGDSVCYKDKYSGPTHQNPSLDLRKILESSVHAECSERNVPTTAYSLGNTTYVI